MKSARVVSLALVLAVILTVGAPAWADHKDSKKRLRSGELFCTARTLLVGSVLIERNRCFRLAVLHDRRGVFLAFFEPTVILPASQVVFLSSPQSFRVRERILFLVPIQTTAQVIAVVPVNTVQLVPVIVEDLGPRVTIILGNPLPQVIVQFVTRVHRHHDDDDDD